MKNSIGSIDGIAVFLFSINIIVHVFASNWPAVFGWISALILEATIISIKNK